MSARFEVVRSDAEQPWHARFRAANGRIVWTMENYTERRNALNAIASFVNPFYGWLEGGAVCTVYSRDAIRDVDERDVVR